MKDELLMLLFLCHWIADYTHLSTSWMLSAKRFGKPLIPIFIHACVHVCLMVTAIKLTMIYHSDFRVDIIYQVALIQLLTHFIIDVWKGRMNGWFPAIQSPANKWHWIVFGFDQFLHALVIIFMASLICAK